MMNVHCTMPQTYELTFTMALLQKEIRIFFIFFIWAWIFLTILLKIFFCRAFVTGNWNTLLFVPFLFVEITLKGSKQGVIAMHWRRSFSAPYYWAISYCHLGLRTRSRFRTLILNNPKFYHCCISWSLPEVSFLFYKWSILVLTRSFFCWWSWQNQNHPQDTGRRQGWRGGGATTSE